MKNKALLIIQALILVVAVAYLVFMPQKISMHFEDNMYNEWLKRKMPDETHVLTLWHIVEFKPFSGSLSSYFSDYSKKFEKMNKGVFIESLTMTTDEYEERIGRGESADIYSFPLSLIDSVPIKSAVYREKTYLFDTSKYGSENGERRAVPYALSGSFLVGNSEKLQKDNIEFSRQNIDFLMENISENEEFLTGKAQLTVVDAGTLGTYVRKYESGKGFMVDAIPIIEEERLLQFLGISDTLDGKRRELATAFIDELFDKEQTEKLCKIGLIPTVENEEATKKFENQYIEELYKLVS